MSDIKITETTSRSNNVIYVKNALNEIFERVGANVDFKTTKHRAELTVNAPENYFDLIVAEVEDKLADVIAVSYKYDYFKRKITVNGLSSDEKELLLTALISADLDDDKKYVYERLKCLSEIAVDGVFNFRLKPLRKKWAEVAGYIPSTFINSQLKEFITFLLEPKTKQVYIDGGKVYDYNYRRLKRASLLDGEECKIIREVLLSGGGRIEISGSVPPLDEEYLREYYGEKIIFSPIYQ
jgi:hypothetical protein